MDRFKFLDNIPYILWTTDVSGKTTYLNNYWYEYTGLNRSLSIDEAGSLAIHPEDYENVLRIYDDAIARKTTTTFEYRIKSGADNKYRWFRANVVPFIEHGEIKGWVGIATNIQDLIEMHDSLKSLNTELENFAYIASHDLREPLRTITSYCELINLKYSSFLDEKGKTYMQFVLNATKRARQMIEALLRYSRLGELNFTAVDCNELIKSIIDDHRLKFEENKARISVERLPVIEADRDAIKSIFENLINNSIKFHRKDIAPEIHIFHLELSDYWKFTVSDNGIGINIEHSSRIFDIFQRINKDLDGTGIGLAICKKLVNRHGGEIWFDSDNGTNFHFTIRKTHDFDDRG